VESHLSSCNSLSNADCGKGWKIESYLHVRANVLYNPLTDLSIGAHEPDYRELRSLLDGRLSVDDLPLTLKDRFIEQGWVIADGPDLSRRFLLKYVSLEARSICNQACYFCPVSAAPRKDQLMPMDLYENIVIQVAAYRDTIEGVFMFNYNEPTMDKRFVEQVSMIKKYGLPPVVNTNASGLTPAIVDKVVGMGGLRYLSINLSTLDRTRYQRDRGKDHLDVVMRNLNYMKNRPIAQQMVIVVLGAEHHEHHRDFQAISDFFSGSNFQVQQAPIMDRAGRLPVGLKPFQLNTKLRGCEQMGSRPLQHLHITAHGKGVLCCQDYNETYIVGDLTKQAVAEVLAGPELARMRRWVYGVEKAPEDFICRRCVFALNG